MIWRSATSVEEWDDCESPRDEPGRFADIPIIPRDAWLEGLANAVVHRSYSIAADQVRVEIFPDLIEITSLAGSPNSRTRSTRRPSADSQSTTL